MESQKPVTIIRWDSFTHIILRCMIRCKWQNSIMPPLGSGPVYSSAEFIYGLGVVVGLLGIFKYEEAYKHMHGACWGYSWSKFQNCWNLDIAGHGDKAASF